MANTYTQIYIQYIFAVQNRISTIQSSWENELYKYMTGFIQNRKHKLIAIKDIQQNGLMINNWFPVDLPGRKVMEPFRMAKAR